MACRTVRVAHSGNPCSRSVRPGLGIPAACSPLATVLGDTFFSHQETLMMKCVRLIIPAIAVAASVVAAASPALAADGGGSGPVPDECKVIPNLPVQQLPVGCEAASGGQLQ
jgi:hypothetical protein